MSRVLRPLVSTLAAAACAVLAAGAAPAQQQECQPLYLVFATGDMHNARLMTQVLQRTKVPATFFAANSPTEGDDAALSRQWGDWWRQMADEGHAMAVQPWDLPLLRGELPPKRGGGFRMKVQTGVLAGRDFSWDGERYCKSLKEASEWMSFYSGRPALPLFHAPGGVMTPKLEKAAQACGYAHVPWPTHFVAGDGASGEETLRRAFAGENVQPGAILLAHMGTWPQQGDEDMKVMEQLLDGLKERGFCFKTLDEHPNYQQWVKQHSAAKAPAKE